MKSKIVKTEYYSCVGHQRNIPTFAVTSSLKQISFKIVQNLTATLSWNLWTSSCTLYV